MYDLLLVPLDGSPTAEEALPLALSIARRAKARLELVTVHALYCQSDPTAGWIHFDVQQDTQCLADEQRYLDELAERITPGADVQISVGVLSGSTILPETIAQSVLERAKATNASLIVMATHGRSALSRLMAGGVADQLVRRSSLPVLVVRASELTGSGNIEEPVLSKILIPLDGSALAEQVLVPARQLAQVMGAACCLVRIVESRAAPHTPSADVKQQTETAHAYLATIASSMLKEGLLVECKVTVAPHAAEAIAQAAQAEGCQLIALSTRGRGGFRRLILGSVADRLVNNASLPLLIYCPSQSKPA